MRDFQNLSGIEDFSANNQTSHSFRRHHQVNPVWANDTAKAEYGERLQQPYEVKHDAQLKSEAERLIAGMGRMKETLKAVAAGDFTPNSDAGQVALNALINSRELTALTPEERIKVCDARLKSGTEAGRKLRAPPHLRHQRPGQHLRRRACAARLVFR